MTYIPGGGAGGGNIATLGDVALNNPANSETLVYDTSVGKWKNAVPQNATVADGSIKTEKLADAAVTDVKIASGISLAKLSTDPLARANHTGTQAPNTIEGLAKFIQDTVATMLNGGTHTNITVSYNNSNGTLSLATAESASSTLEPTGTARPNTLTNNLRYVATTGSDSTGNGTEASPWATPTYGANQLAPGDTLVIRAGTYSAINDYSLPAGTSANRIRVTAYPGEAVTLQGLLRTNAPYWTWDHLTFHGLNSDPATEHQVRFTNAVGVIVEDCDFTAQSGSFASLHITEYSDSTVTVPSNCSVTVRHNYFKRNDSALRSSGANLPNRDHHIYLGGRATSTYTIERNLFEYAPNGDHIKVGPNSAASIAILYNTGHNSIQSLSLEGECDNVQCFRNLWHDATVDRPAGQSRGATILAYNYSGTNTLFYRNWAQARVSLFAGTGTTLNTEITEATGADNIFSATGNPQFTNISIGDYRPQDTTASQYGRYAI